MNVVHGFQLEFGGKLWFAVQQEARMGTEVNEPKVRPQMPNYSLVMTTELRHEFLFLCSEHQKHVAMPHHEDPKSPIYQHVSTMN